MVVICFAGQQAVGPHGDGVCEQTAARTADDGQPLDRLTGIRKLHLHRRAVLRRVAARGKLFLGLTGQFRHRDGFDLAYPAAALGEYFHLLHAEDACQHFVHAALSGIQIGVHAHR